MLRVFFILNLLFMSLLACKGGYNSCKLKVKDSSSIVGNSVQIPILRNKLLIYSQNTPNGKIIKHDPFLALYLVESEKPFKYPFKINSKLASGTASVNNKIVIEGRIVKRQVGLNKFATYSEPVNTPGILLSSCCALEGIVTSEGIIEKEYIQHFLKAKNIVYGNLGIRVEDKNKLVVVKFINPFIKKIPFKRHDIIVSLNGQEVKHSYVFMRKILFSKIGSTHTIKIKRQNKFYTFNVKTIKRYGGGYLSDTILESKGLYLNKQLQITKILKNFPQYGLQVGDRLLMVNKVHVKNQIELKKNISAFDNKVLLLFDRNKFTFFIQLD